MQRNMIKWRRSVLQSPRRLALPVMTHPGIEKLGATVKQAVCDGDLHFRAIQVLAETWPTAASTMIMDLSVEAEAFGATAHLTDHDIPAVKDNIVRSAESIEKLAVPPLTAGRLPQFLKAARQAAEAIKDRPVMAGCVGPFSLAGRLYDMTEIMMDVIEEPEKIHALLEKCTAFLINYVKAFRDAGVSGIFMAEPAAGVLSPKLCDQFSSAYVKRIVEATQTDTFVIILHNCGNTGVQNKSMVSTGAWGFHLGNRNDIAKSLPDFPADALVMGNIDPAGTMKMGSPEQVTSEVSALLAKTAGAKNFVLSTGCDTPPLVPWKNVEAFFGALDAFNKTRG